jgi:hypothetical protein
MKTFNQYITLTEGFDKPYKWEWNRGGLQSVKSASFVTDSGGGYRVKFTQRNVKYLQPFNNSNVWTTDFSLKNDWGSSWGISGTGDAFRVFATVIDIMKDFLKDENPDAVTFSASEKSRKELYRAMIKRLPRFTKGYELLRNVKVPNSREEHYFIKNKKFHVPPEYEDDFVFWLA